MSNGDGTSGIAADQNAMPEAVGQTECDASDSVLYACPVVPVLVIQDGVCPAAVGEALMAGGITTVEVTLRTAAGLDAIRRMVEITGLTVGAGSVLRRSQVDQVADAGARFVISPGLSKDVLMRARDHGLEAIPGIATPSELMSALTLGITTVKVFPAGLLGGPAFIAALSGPFRNVTFMPSGGVGPHNLMAYLTLPAVPAVSGSWMVEESLLSNKNWSDVTARSATAIGAAAAAWRGGPSPY